MTMQKHFVTFLSPGTFVAEQSAEEIDAWDVDLAMEMAHNVKERYGATPYGFYFTTRERGEQDFDSHESGRSGTYYLGGKVETLADVKARNDPTEKTLRSNMECNGYTRIVTNDNSWRWTQPLCAEDVVLDWEPKP